MVAFIKLGGWDPSFSVSVLSLIFLKKKKQALPRKFAPGQTGTGTGQDGRDLSALPMQHGTPILTILCSLCCFGGGRKRKEHTKAAFRW